MAEWMQALLQQDVDAEKDNGGVPLQLLNTKSRKFIWWMCIKYNALSQGLMGSACNLLERYLAKKVLMPNLAPNSDKWRQIKHDIKMRSPLLVSVCIALSSKMRSSSRHINLNNVQSVLGQYFYYYTIKEIKDAEAEVFSIVGFKIPLYTNVERAETIATYLGITEEPKLEAIALVMQITELHRPFIQEKVSGLSCSRYHIGRRYPVKNVRHVHLVAGVLAATSLFFKWRQSHTMVRRLASLTNTSFTYITVICNLIVGLLQKDFGEKIGNITMPESRKKQRYH